MSTVVPWKGSPFSEQPTATGADLPAETARLLDACHVWVRRFVVLNDAQATILAVWVLHTWAIHCASLTPYIHVTSAELGSGKTTLLLTLRAIVREPRFTDNMSPAAMARIVSTVRPTLLVDELDAVLRADKERAQDLRGILNGGFELHGTYTRCVGKDFAVQSFPTFCPKVLSGIGELWPTVASRAIRIEVKRRLPGERIEHFRTRRIVADSEPLRNSLAVWAEHANELLKNSPEPDDISGLTDRQSDIAEPLLQIAALAGEEHLRALTAALETVLKARSGEEHCQSVGVSLLCDVRTIFDEERADRLPSSHLVHHLCGVEGRPWADWNHGRGMTPNNLARQLGGYGIAPGTIRTGSGTIKGYKRADFEETWERLCPTPPVRNVTTSQAAPPLDETAISKRHVTDCVTAQKSRNLAPVLSCDAVTFQNPECWAETLPLDETIFANPAKPEPRKASHLGTGGDL